jgi:sulfur transfer protein SufE
MQLSQSLLKRYAEWESREPSRQQVLEIAEDLAELPSAVRDEDEHA